MKEYDETTLKIAERVLKRSDEIIEQRKTKSSKRDSKRSEDVVTQSETRYSKIHHFTYALPGICAAVVLCFCILGLSKYAKNLNNGGNDSYPITTSNTIIVSSSTTTSTSIVTETTTTVAETTAIVTETSVTSSDTVTTTDIEDDPVQDQSSEDSNDITEETENIIPQDVITTTTAKTTTPTVTTPVNIVKPTLCGDANGDNMVDIEDAVLVRGYVNSGGKNWAEYYKNNKAPGSKISADQALANADAYRASEKREITSEDADAIMGYINGDYPYLPIDEL